MVAGVPPVSRRSQPRFSSRARRDELAGAFLAQGADYDRLRPGYPPAAVQLIVQAAWATRAARAAGGGEPLQAVDLGAGTGQLTRALARAGCHVTAVDPSASMLERIGEGADDAVADVKHGPEREALAQAGAEAADAGVGSGRIQCVIGSAEATGLEEGCADLVTAAQAWHWFDVEAASAEAQRLLRPGGVLALLWNTMDVQVPWVHRLARIMHAGDVQRDGFTPPVGEGLHIVERHVLRWEDPMVTPDLIDLARTRSYVATAKEQTRAKVLANLDWYLHEHLGHARGATVHLPYRTDLFLLRATPARV